MENHIDKFELRMENEVIDKLRALFDAREVQNDVNERIINALNRIEAKCRWKRPVYAGLNKNG